MKVSTEICSASRHVGEEKAIELIAKAGFDCYDFSLCDMARVDWSTMTLKESNHPSSGSGYVDFAKRIRKVADDCGIECNQSHAPFPTRVVGMDYIKRTIECTAIAGGKICIVHPDNNFSAEENAQMYAELLPFAKEHGVKIATENMWNWEANATQSCFAACSTAEDFVKHIDLINDPYFIACLDIGHAEMAGSGSGAYNMIKALGPRLGALHIHDNDLIGDTHQIPFSMCIDFEKVVQGLKEVNYQGELTLEADRYLESFHAQTVESGIKNLYTAVNRIREMMK